MDGDMPETKPIDQVRIVRALLVKPAKPMKRHSMFMSGVDQMLSATPPSRTILFYKTDTHLAKAVEDLRRGLANALVAFYPMAGRLIQDNNRLAIDCNDEGVELIEACCDIPFAQLECKNFHIQVLFRHLVPMDTHETSDILDAPLASFQVTTFVGGLTVGITVSHALADGHATWMFIKAIGEACRGEPITTIPLHARILLKPDVFTIGVSFPYMPLEEVTKSDGALYSGFSSDPLQSSSLPSELAEPHIIHFSQDMLENLKKACTSTSDHNIEGGEVALKYGSFVISTYQALAAYLWKRLTMAQGLHDDKSTDLRVSLDVRMRMIPALTPAYFGNAVVGVPTPTTAGELIGESLSATAQRIWQSIHKADDAYIKKAMTAREGLDLRNLRNTSSKTMVIRNGSRFPVYEGGNFGWGEPEVARPSYSVWKEGMFTWYPGKNPKCIDVIAPLTSTTCAHFFSPHLYPNDPLCPSAFPYSRVP